MDLKRLNRCLGDDMLNEFILWRVHELVLGDCVN